MDPKLEIRKLPLNKVRELALILDYGDSWKSLMAKIPKELGMSGFQSDIGPHNPAKYKSEHFWIIEQGSRMLQRSCTEILLDEWGSSGKQRANLGHLKYLLNKAKLYRAADYICELLGEEPPPRPTGGPGAMIMPHSSEVDNIVEKHLDELKYPEVAIEQIRRASLDTTVRVASPTPVIPEIVVIEPQSGFQEEVPLVTMLQSNNPPVLSDDNPETSPRQGISDEGTSSNAPPLSELFTDSSTTYDSSDNNIEQSISVHIQNSNNGQGHNLNEQTTPSVDRPLLSELMSDLNHFPNEENSDKDETETGYSSTNLVKSNCQKGNSVGDLPPLSELLSGINYSVPDCVSDSNQKLVEEIGEVPALSGLLPDPNQNNIQNLENLVASESTDENSIIPNLSELNLELPLNSETRNTRQTKCASPLPNLTLNTELPHFSYAELERVTNNFSSDEESGMLLGSGGFGSVFLATNLVDKPVAVKKIYLDENVERVDENDEVTKQFRNEVEVLCKYKHENLVSLLGYSCDGRTFCLVYEYVPGGCLYDKLQKQPQELQWKDRLNVAFGTSKAIAYLHTAFSAPLIHRDIKSTNILLDEKNNAKICDFGITKVLQAENSGLDMPPWGTSAYMSPEYQMGEISTKLDVYSFGVVLLELLSSLQPLDPDREWADLVTHAEAKCEEGIQSIVDPRAGSWEENGVNFAEEVFRIAVECVDDKDKRPEMEEIVKALQEHFKRLS